MATPLGRRLSAEEVSALGLDTPEVPAKPQTRRLSAEEVSALGLDKSDTAKEERIARTTKAGMIPEPTFGDKIKTALNPSSVAKDLGAVGATFNDSGFGLPGRAMDALGLSSQHERDTLKKDSPVGEFMGNAIGAATDVATGPQKIIAEGVEAGVKAVTPKVTSKITDAAIAAGKSATTGAAIGAADASARGGDFKDVIDRAQDYGTGALLIDGGAKGAVKGTGWFGANRQAKVDSSTVRGMVEGGTAKQQAKVLGERGVKRDDLLEVANEVPGLAKAAQAKNTTKSIELIEAHSEKLNAGNRATYAATEAVSPGTKVSDLFGRLEAVRDKLKTTLGGFPLAKVVDEKLAAALEVYGNRTHIPASELRKIATDLGPKAFRSAPGIDPGDGEKAGREIYRTVVSMVEDDVAANATRAGLPSTAVQTLREANKKISQLIDVETTLARRAQAEAAGKEGLGERVSKAVDKGLKWGSVGAAATGNPLLTGALIAGAGIKKAWPPIGRAGDRLIANIYQAAKNGEPAGAIQAAIDAAIKAGVPRVVANGIATRFAKKD